ncbi:class I SAM-dependent methyltransferase [Marinobacter caseinilyticus]|uniref:class I SAM-dependent methyltransferase n=1 Tax=Marinobacter caseinilyticus TaxID=2692195 RepID=UPI00140BB4C8|nr:class I SAM-dependent methyltransferase [Marinobacter caseinilyticus]
MNASSEAIHAHHRPVAETWGSGGEAYDRISFYISDALSHAAQRLNAQPGERVLDVATGTGWTARNVAAYGAQVTAVDIAQPLLTAAEALSRHVRPSIDFQLADAEQLPFENRRFDRVISTFGAMFAANHHAVARELGRVCKPGGRLVMSTWASEGAVKDFFAVIGQFSDAPVPQPSPLAWGDPTHVGALLGDDFELTIEAGTNHSYNDNVADIWAAYRRGFGPIRQLAQALSPARAEAFRAAVDAYHAQYRTDDGLIHIHRDYRIIIGQRR